VVGAASNGITFKPYFMKIRSAVLELRPEDHGNIYRDDIIALNHGIILPHHDFQNQSRWYHPMWKNMTHEF
jgi:hypothetical protein